MMKRESWFTLLSGFFFALLVSFSCTACIASAFDLHIKSATNPVAVDLKSLLALCIVFSLLMSSFHTWKLSSCAIVSLVLLFLYFWFFQDLKLSLEALCNAISKRYSNTYGWSELRWSTAPLSRVDKTLALQILAAPICAAVTWTVCRRQELVWALAAAIVPIVPCTFITSTVPDPKFLGLWLVALVLLFLTQASRKRSARQGNRMLLILTLPVTLAVILLFRFAPQESYNGKKTADALLRKLQSLFSISASDVGGGRTKESIDLFDTGYLRQRRVPVMTVNAPTSGTYYLRGRAYDTYTGMQWTDSGKDYELPWSYDVDATPIGNFSIETRYLEDVLYYPYASTSYFHQALDAPTHNYIDNEDGRTEYSFDIYAHTQSHYFMTDSLSFAPYLSLPRQTQEWAEETTAEILLAVSYTSIEQEALIRSIQNYVKNSATYSLKTPRMDTEYDDFAQWFLEESETGYCVHFATAATVLLRAAGVPARYVTGYAVDTVAGEEVTVYELDAHAWVEYWDSSRGWLILDPTPGVESGNASNVPQESSTSPTRPSTQPSSTSEPSEPTKPTTTKRPSGTSPSATSKEEDSSLAKLWQMLKYMFLVLLPFALLWAQWRLRLMLRRSSRRRGTPKERILKSWRQSLLYAHALGQAPDKDLRKLAEKAKFSQHTPSEEELRQFDAYFRTSIDALKSRSVWKRIYARLILALY